MSGLVAHFRAMARNNAWSNHRLLRACACLSEAEYTAVRTSFFPSIRETLDHILLVDTYYLDMLEGRSWRPWVPTSGFGELDTAQRRSDRRLATFCDALDEARLETVVILDRGEQGRFPERAAAVLAHLFVHQIHHRGQVHAMLSGTSVAPPQLDEFFLDQDARLRSKDFAELGWPD